MKSKSKKYYDFRVCKTKNCFRILAINSKKKEVYCKLCQSFFDINKAIKNLNIAIKNNLDLVKYFKKYGF